MAAGRGKIASQRKGKRMQHSTEHLNAMLWNAVGAQGNDFLMNLIDAYLSDHDEHKAEKQRLALTAGMNWQKGKGVPGMQELSDMPLWRENNTLQMFAAAYCKRIGIRHDDVIFAHAFNGDDYAMFYYPHEAVRIIDRLVANNPALLTPRKNASEGPTADIVAFPKDDV